MPVAERKSAEERREEILEAALVEFAAHGLYGGSTEAIARAVGISQPYVFRLFGTKKELFTATIERCMRGTLEMMQSAAAGLKGEEALHAIGEAYAERLATDPTYLHSQMQAYAACDDPAIRDGGAERLPRARRLRRTGFRTAAGTGLALLREGDASERDRVDGPARCRRRLGAAPHRGLPPGRLRPFFSS